MESDKIPEQKPPVPAEAQKAVLETDAPEKLDGFAQLKKAFRAAMARARGQNPQAGNNDRKADKTRKVLVLAILAVGLAIAFLVVFSNPKKPVTADSRRNKPNLGTKETPGSDSRSARSVTPIMDSKPQPSSEDNSRDVTAEDVSRTASEASRNKQQPASDTQTRPNPQTDSNSLRTLSFGPPTNGNELAPPPSEGPAPVAAKATLNKPSIVFVRSEQNKAQTVQNSQTSGNEPGNHLSGVLPPGTKLVARLESPVSSAIHTPVIAVIEYNYERNGEIILPAGAKVIGKLDQVSPTGAVNLQFSTIELPDGTEEKVDASAMSLSYGPLKGSVSGRKRGTRFLVSALTGIGSMASLLAGSNPASTLDAPVSEGTLLRERLADNIGQAGQQELNSLSLNQNIVVTVPGSTRFYVVLQRGAGTSGDTQSSSSVSRAASSTPAGANRIPTVEELRQLMELRRELNQVYEQPATTATGNPGGNQ